MTAQQVFLVSRAVSALAFATATLSQVFLIVDVELSAFELVIVGSVLEGTVLLLEFPTGVVADVYSRRLSVLIGMTLTGVGFLLYAVPQLPVILAGQVVWGAGYTFISGAFVAWIADEVGEETAAPLYLRAAQVAQAAGFVGIGLAVALGTVALWVPLATAGVVYLGLAMFLLVAMPESGFVRHEHRSGQFRATAGHVRRAVARRPVLLAILAVAAVNGMSSEAYDRLSPLRLVREVGLPGWGNLSPAVWFGIIAAVGSLASVAAIGVARRRVDVTSGPAIARALGIVNLLMVAAMVTFALTERFVAALVTMWVVSVLVAVTGPLYTAWVNRDLDPRARATINSIGGQFDALGQVTGGPLLGLLASARSVTAAIMAGALVRVPAAVLYSRTSR